MSDVAQADVIRARVSGLAEALLAAAHHKSATWPRSADLMQHALLVFPHPAFPATGVCREVLLGPARRNRWHSPLAEAIPVAVHPSDPAVALLALDAVVLTRIWGERRIPIETYLPPGRRRTGRPASHGELIVGVDRDSSPAGPAIQGARAALSSRYLCRCGHRP
jgi:CO/xanthine dehydrogenase FAD-binding subunit